MIERPSITMNRSAVIALVVVIALIGGGWALGYKMGTDHGKLVAAQNPPRQQTVSGTVKSADEKGMTIETPNGEWKVIYAETTEFRSGSTEVKRSEFKKGDTVRVLGTVGGENKGRTLNARTIVKVPPRPSVNPKDPKADPKAAAPAPTKSEPPKK